MGPGGKGVRLIPAQELTPREREVLQLLAEGLASKEIAARLEVAVSTIESHRKQIMDKLGLRSVAELTKYAIRTGLTTVE
jgi:DNA-binding NarL/FixJ family response regulator